MRSIDINCDMGESFGIYHLGIDHEILNYITSANIACGFHAGDPNVMRKTVQLALEKGVLIGAHPGYQDLAGFGRREIKHSAEEIYNLIVYQVGALEAFVRVEGGKLHHVKPHGALYNLAANNFVVALAIAQAVKDINSRLVLYGLANSALIDAGNKVGIKVAHEVFVDRTYKSDGTLTPRSEKSAVITCEKTALRQIERICRNGTVVSIEGKEVVLQADTICIHGDNEKAVAFAKKLHMYLY